MSQPTTDEAVLLMYAPYLPLREHLDINGWALVPADELEQGEVASDFAAVAAALLARLYTTGDDDAGTGAFAYRVGEGVGGHFDESDVLDMHRALVVLALDGNPSPFRPDEERTGNEAHRAMTSDNALV